MPELSDTEVEFVYHIADIHIRLYARHIEYRSVFERLYQYLESEKTKVKNKSIIVICGDIFHSKNELSPNCISLCSELFKKLCSIMPVIVIMGNHDINSGNKNHLDALTPIINNLDLDNLYYLSQSGVYNYGNISFIVTSILNGNKLVNYKTAKSIGKLCDITIALYHGLVSGCVNDVGTRLNSELSVDDFKNFDYAFLGDNHKHQFLNDTVAYSGSLIGQNYSEHCTNHGLIKWN
jgi:DNA repair exonuclease SbcCD nuclease subunit